MEPIPISHTVHHLSPEVYHYLIFSSTLIRSEIRRTNRTHFTKLSSDIYRDIDRLFPPDHPPYRGYNKERYIREKYDGFLMDGLVKSKNYITFIEKEIDPEKILQSACKIGNKKLIRFAIEKGASNWSSALQTACEGGQKEIAEHLMTEYAPKPNYGSRGAVTGGHLDLVKLLIEKGADNEREMIYHAALNNHPDIVHYLIKTFKKPNTVIGGSPFFGAALGGHRDLLNELLSKRHDHLRSAFHGACAAGSLDLVQELIEKGANFWDLGLSGASRSGNKQLVKYMLEKGATKLNEALHHAALFGHYHIIKYLIKKGATKLNKALGLAARHNYPDVVKLLIERGANKIDQDAIPPCQVNDHNLSKLLNRQMKKIVPSRYINGPLMREGHSSIEIFKLLRQLKLVYWDRGFLWACREGNYSVVKLMIENNTTLWRSGIFMAKDLNKLDVMSLLIVNGVRDKGPDRLQNITSEELRAFSR